MRGSRSNNRGGTWRVGSSIGRGFRGNRGNRSNRGNYGNNWQSQNSSNFSGQKWVDKPKRETPGKRLGEDEIGLTDLSPPEPPAGEQVDDDEELLLTKYNVEILPLDTWDQINKLKAFGDVIVGSTVNVDDKKLMRFEKFRKGARIDNRVKWLWPGEYVYFIVHKENCDTMDAATRIAEKLRMHARRVDPRKLATAGRGLRDLALGNYSFHRDHLKLGMLKGNK
ncbi:tRNA pseudouridine synthase D [Operophtera brumata]|uniref:tRNA pseudouridine synthase D n=1 Tax=Operophtera brumata TaxID=104452 RepID=A0A0L7L6U8_OPEBR|nr:tRNA pseudouridine synthase D [Operophtera brumata]